VRRPEPRSPHPRAALLALALAALLPSGWRAWAGRGAPPRACVPEGRGAPPRHWIGCAGDPGPPRPLDGLERLALGLPLDVNRAGPRELAAVPGLSPALAAALVADRERRGPFGSVEAVLRVRGIGPARLARAAPHLVAGRPPVE
jgi:competence protein ComEA